MLNFRCGLFASSGKPALLPGGVALTEEEHFLIIRLRSCDFRTTVG